MITASLIGDSRECEILINTTHSCNLRCRYCFVADGLKSSPAPKMEKETQEACLAFMEAYCRSYERITLHFYGGEPFLNFDAVRHISERALSIFGAEKTRFAVTTNGTLIDRGIAGFLASLGFSVLVSCDGPPAVHDRMRTGENGLPTSQRVLDTIRALKSYEKITVGLSSVIHKENSLAAAYGYLKSLSPAFIKAEHIRTGPGDALDLDEEDRKRYFEDLAFVADDIIEQLTEGRQPLDYRFNSRVLQMWRGVRRKEFCGAGSSVLGIAADGDVYPCTLLVGDNSCRLGDVWNGLSTEAVERFRRWHALEGKESCSRCPDRYYCGGGCAAMWKMKGRGFCEYIREEIRLAAHIYERISETRPEALALMVSKEFHDRLANMINTELSSIHEETV
ncbi:MAG: radical SAM protein [Nitrospirae bacterium]|nr:radical SAM protein [Nitrospirota bacterium]